MSICYVAFWKKRLKENRHQVEWLRVHVESKVDNSFPFIMHLWVLKLNTSL
jgi:hypothetical protein